MVLYQWVCLCFANLLQINLEESRKFALLEKEAIVADNALKEAMVVECDAWAAADSAAADVTALLKSR